MDEQEKRSMLGLGPGRPLVGDGDASKTWENAGGAKRSSPMLPWEMIWWGALRGMITRFEIGLKYGYQNWKRALSVPREKWHDGEPGPGSGVTDDSALGFVRQFYAHAGEHWFQAMQLVDKPTSATSPKGDNLEDNLYAWLWNVGCAVEYFVQNPDMFREAFSQWPADSPFHRLDRGRDFSALTACPQPVAEPNTPSTEGACYQAAPGQLLANVTYSSSALLAQLGKATLYDSRVRIGDFEIIKLR